MITANKVRVLWITDIHFQESYRQLEGQPLFITFREKLLALIKSEFHNEYPLDYLLVSGDLAHHGSEGDYTVFIDMLLGPVLKSLTPKKGGIYPKVITIPGNHDVYWEKGDFFQQYLDFLLPGDSEVKRADFLSQHQAEFEELFIYYTQFVTKQQTGIYEEFFKLNTPGLKAAKCYTDKRLYGYLIDHDKRIILMLFNTAWFCLGGHANKLFSGEIMARIAESKTSSKGLTVEDVQDWLKKQDQLAEYNHQLSGVSFFYDCELIEYLRDYPDYFVTSVCHHPRNWLEWDESYTYKTGDINNAKKLNELLASSDLLLTGHEHIPMETEGEILFKKTLHLKGGCFLFDKQLDKREPQLTHCWFSMLDIDTEKKQVSQKKVYFDATPEEQNWRTQTVHHPVPAPLPYYTLNPNRASKVGQLFVKKSKVCLKPYLESFLGKKGYFTDWKALPNMLQAPCELYKGVADGQTELCILAIGGNFYSQVVLNNAFIGKLTDLLNLHSDVKAIRLVVPDLFVDAPPMGFYTDRKSRDEALGSVIRQADNFYNIFRFRFFTRYESSMYRGSALIDMFKKYRDISIVNHVIPYYVIERYWLK